MLTDRGRCVVCVPLLILLGAPILAGCGRAPSESAAPPAAGAEERIDARSRHTWSERHIDPAKEGDGSYEAIVAGQTAALPYQRIRLTLDTHYPFATLELELERGGRATRRGGMIGWPEEWRGEATGKVRFHEYADLCWLIDRLDLPRESAQWTHSTFHGETVELSWTDAKGRTVALSDYGDSGPPELHALRAAVESIALRIEWTPSPAAEPR